MTPEMLIFTYSTPIFRKLQQLNSFFEAKHLRGFFFTKISSKMLIFIRKVLMMGQQLNYLPKGANINMIML